MKLDLTVEINKDETPQEFQELLQTFLMRVVKEMPQGPTPPELTEGGAVEIQPPLIKTYSAHTS